MSTTMSKIAVVIIAVGLGGGVSAISGHPTDAGAAAPAAQQAAKANDNMCVIAASFSANPLMAKEIGRAAGCR